MGNSTELEWSGLLVEAWPENTLQTFSMADQTLLRRHVMAAKSHWLTEPVRQAADVSHANRFNREQVAGVLTGSSESGGRCW